MVGASRGEKPDRAGILAGDGGSLTFYLDGVKQDITASNGGTVANVTSDNAGSLSIGKTTFASQYYHAHQADYTHMAWVFAETSLIDALLTQL